MDLSVKAFTELGYLQEVNRRLLHPLGLALFTYIADDGIQYLGGIEDHRAEPGGVVLCEPRDASHSALRLKKASYVDEQWALREPGRLAELGYMVQPVDGG